ncbi:uncharacterized protein LOC135691120 [Rhopilema esculentum]|uniref:uncharacterized protein LOC135691120 n=1 Tax=Rhopilema esculentum TaxID=499914 RepID=UPI0031DFAAFA|eukprot:gene1631-16096_t
MNISALSQPSLKGSRVPTGHVLVHLKFQGGPIIKLLQETGITPVIQEGLGVVDFYPSNSISVVWITEEVIIGSSSSVLKKIKKLDEGRCSGIALVEVTELSKQYYKELQLSTMVDFNVPLIPVRSVNEMAKVVAQLVYSKSQPNPIIKCSRSGINMDESVLATLKSFPMVGGRKAVSLINKFSSIDQINKASIQELEALVGRPTALHVKGFLEGKKAR